MYKKIKREYIDTLQINGLTNLQQVYAVCTPPPHWGENSERIEGLRKNGRRRRGKVRSGRVSSLHLFGSSYFSTDVESRFK
jgi:hypothetical protein